MSVCNRDIAISRDRDITDTQRYRSDMAICIERYR